MLRVRPKLLFKRCCLTAGLMHFGSPVYACFGGYSAPAFLDVTDPTIGAGIVTIIVAMILAALRRSFGALFVMPLLFLGIAYFGHWTYSGDCGAMIVRLNMYALLFAAVWFGFEALKLVKQLGMTTTD